MPEEFKFDVVFQAHWNKFDICLWGGCKPNWQMKRWCHWNELLHNLSYQGYKIAIVGLKGEGDFEIKPYYNKVFDFRGKLSLLQTGGVISNSTKYIGNEGGLTHYSAAVGTETYVLMGGSDVVKNVPPGIGQKVVPLSAGMNCQPCQFDNPWRNEGVIYGCNQEQLVEGRYARCLHGLTAEMVCKQACGEVFK